MKFTKAQKKKYIENPNICPYCKSEDISGENFEAGYNQAWREIECNSCGKEWMEIFTMTDIEEQGGV